MIKEIIYGIRNLILDRQKKKTKINVIKFEKLSKEKNINIKKGTKNKIVIKNKNNKYKDKDNSQNILKSVMKIMKYNDEELNSLRYQYALVMTKGIIVNIIFHY